MTAQTVKPIAKARAELRPTKAITATAISVSKETPDKAVHQTAPAFLRAMHATEKNAVKTSRLRSENRRGIRSLEPSLSLPAAKVIRLPLERIITIRTPPRHPQVQRRQQVCRTHESSPAFKLPNMNQLVVAAN